MRYPKFIKQNDYIDIPAPSVGSGAIEKKNEIINAKRNLET